MYGKRTKKIIHYLSMIISILMVISMIAMYALPTLFRGGSNVTKTAPPTIKTEVKDIKIDSQNNVKIEAENERTSDQTNQPAK